MIPYLERMKPLWGRPPDKVVADAGYGSQENLERRGLAAFVKFPTFRRERRRAFAQDPFRARSAIVMP